MTRAPSDSAELVPIDEMRRRFGLRASAIRYYEQRGLLEPVSRHSGRRWCGPAEMRRLAIIQYWQGSGLMSLEEIREILAGPTATGRWGQVIEDRIEALRAQIKRMKAAKRFLEHVSSKHDDAPNGCPHHEALIWNRSSGPPVRAHRTAEETRNRAGPISDTSAVAASAAGPTSLTCG